MMAATFGTKKCCNPFNNPHHPASKKNLRPVLNWMCEKLPGLSLKQKVCDQCRKKLSTYQKESGSSSENDDVVEPTPALHIADEDSLEGSSTSFKHEIALSTLNQSLQTIGESPIIKKKLGQSKYPKEKSEKIGVALKRKILCVESDSDVPVNTESEILTQLKDKFNATSTSKSEQVQILTILPLSWSIKKIEEQFGCSDYMVRKAKKLVKEKGILSTPNPKPGKVLSQKTADSVREFYNSDEVSRALPGMKDFVSVKQPDGKRVHVQKRLVLGNLKEIYKLFKENHQTLNIGFSKFAELRPKNCILAGASGTHSVCVCTIHQNVKLMMLGGKIEELTKDDDFPLKTYNHVLPRMICNPPLPTCYLGDCTCCPGPLTLKQKIQNLLDVEAVDYVTFRQWVAVDRTTLETVIEPVDSFLDILFEKLEVLRRHSFIATQQSTFLNDLKSQLQQKEFITICDFAENYSFVLQDEVQGYHWNNSQASLHPFVVYYKDEQGIVQHVSLVIISECLSHDTTAVHLFQRLLVNYLKEKVGGFPAKIYYFSDGAASQYKNKKNFLNLCHHQEDFGVDAEWHFFATSHGKGPCDGVGGTVKRLAARASLQRPYEQQIMTPRQLFDWATKNVTAVEFRYTTNEDHLNEEAALNERFARARTIAGTQKLHAFIPASKHTVVTKIFSAAAEKKNASVCVLEDELELNKINGFVACVYGEEWWLGCVLEVNESEEEVKLSFLHPHGPAPSFKYPSRNDVLSVPAYFVLTKVDPHTPTGRVYNLNDKESREATRKLQLWKNKHL